MRSLPKHRTAKIWQVQTQEAWAKVFCSSEVRYEGFKYFQTLTNPLQLRQCVFLCVYFVLFFFCGEFWIYWELLYSCLFLLLLSLLLFFLFCFLSFSRLCVLSESHAVTKGDSLFSLTETQPWWEICLKVIMLSVPIILFIFIGALEYL